MAVLVEHDLWAGTAPLRRPRMRRERGAVRAGLWGRPRPLGAVCARLGGGRPAFERLCRRGMELVWSACGLGRPPDLPAVTGVGAYLGWLLDRLDRPLGTAVARSLWVVRLPPLPRPRPGELLLLACRAHEVGERLAAELVARVRATGARAWRVAAGREDDTAPWPAVVGGGLVAIHGEVTEADLAAAERAATAGSAVVVVGGFPAGWDPPPAVAALPGDAVVTAGAPGIARPKLPGRFDPSDPADREALDWLASHRFEPPPAAAEEGGIAARLLRLAPEGLPEGVLLAVPGVGPRTLAALEEAGEAVRDGGRWRPLRRRSLRRDPLHRLLAEAEPPGSPARALRAALAGDDPRPLERWLEERIEALDTRRVRELLDPCEPQDLPPAARTALAAACLLELDPGGARRALEGLEGPRAAAARAWLEGVDRDTRWRPRALPPEAVEADPLAAAGAAVEAWIRCARSGSGDAGPFARTLRAAAERLDGPARRWAELGAAWAGDRHRLLDREFRRRVVTGQPLLVRRWLHLAGLAARELGRLRAARRALRAALEVPPITPGWAGLLELDLGAVDLAAGRTAEAELHHLRALRLLEVAGFQGRTEVARFNLAVAALDRLDLGSAAGELARLPGDDPYVAAERARLALARGDEDACRRWRRRVAAVGDGAPLAEAVALLDGVLALLEGRRAVAREALAGGGSEGEVWSALLRALEGDAPGPDPGDDGWGVARAARWLAAPGGPAALDAARLDLRDAFAVALLERLGAGGEVSGSVRAAAARRLERAGMRGWARRLRPARDLDGVLRPLVRLAEEGLAGVDGGGGVGPLLEALGLGGVEVRSPGDGAVALRLGGGEPAAETVRGGVRVVALGGEPAEEALWRLLVHLLAASVPAEPTAGEDDLGLVGRSEAMRRLREDLRSLAPGRLAVLVQGETGVGKELAARALHRLSGRRGRFVPVNVAALPETLVEAELFGAVRGAYTGAVGDRAGLVRAAHGGTLFLDEIGELEPRLQAKLLRFLESGEVRPVGSDRAERVDVRVVTATHRDLERMVAEGTFRADLYYRLATAVVRVPPLRERREDIPLLVAIFQAEAVRAGAPAPSGWSPAAERALLGHAWPGNVRELRHVVEAALARARGGPVLPGHLGIPGGEGGRAPAVRRWDEAVAALRRDLIREALEAAGGNRSRAARLLGISRQTLLYHMRVLGLGGGPVPS